MLNRKLIDSVLISYDVQLFMVLLAVIFFFLLSLAWDVYFIKRIFYFKRSRRLAIQQSLTDPFENYAQAAHTYKVEIYKYIFLLIINMTEFITMLIYGIASLLPSINEVYNGKVEFPRRITISNCTNFFESPEFINMDLRLAVGSPVFLILESLGQIGLLLSLAFCICLMKYLLSHYYTINRMSSQIWIKRFLLATISLCVFLFIFGSVPQLMIIQRSVLPLVQLAYLVIWIKYTRKFYKALRWRTIEYRIRYTKDWIIQKSVISTKQFALIMTLIGFGTACFILIECLVDYLFLTSIAISFGPCLFNYLYGTPNYESLLLGQQQMYGLDLSSQIIYYFTLVLMVLASISIGTEYLLATMIFFGRIILRKLKFRFGKVRTRYTPNLMEPLLI